MKYPYSIELFREADGTLEWVARSKSLKGCIGVGDTQETAVKELAENEVAWLETASEVGIPIPDVPVKTDKVKRQRKPVAPRPQVSA